MYQLKDQPYFTAIEQSYYWGIVKSDEKNDRAFVQPEVTIARDKSVAWGQMARMMQWVDLDDLVELA